MLATPRVLVCGIQQCEDIQEENESLSTSKGTALTVRRPRGGHCRLYTRQPVETKSVRHIAAALKRNTDPACQEYNRARHIIDRALPSQRHASPDGLWGDQPVSHLCGPRHE